MRSRQPPAVLSFGAAADPSALRLYGLLVAAALLVGCASKPGLRPGRDGPEARPPPGLERVPDAEPRVEALRGGGPNKPYEVFGRRYTPLPPDAALEERGLASWYGRKFHGQPTASGEPYDMYAMTAAHKTMPLPSYARVRNPANGREVIVRVNDRGPFADGRVIDLSYTAALKLGVLGGVAPVQVQRITPAEIRAGSWRQPNNFAQTSPEPPREASSVALEDGLPGDPLAAGLWLQLGAFRSREGALQLQQRALRDSDAAPAVALVEDGALVRVQAGPYPSRDLALAALARLRAALGVEPLLVERPERQPTP